jgi:hypothetical protein
MGKGCRKITFDIPFSELTTSSRLGAVSGSAIARAVIASALVTRKEMIVHIAFKIGTGSRLVAVSGSVFGSGSAIARTVAGSVTATCKEMIAHIAFKIGTGSRFGAVSGSVFGSGSAIARTVAGSVTPTCKKALKIICIHSGITAQTPCRNAQASHHQHHTSCFQYIFKHGAILLSNY